jgi:serine/tyrosine/threonine adenylyltransferase
MLREYLVSDAMHALGIPTTRALAVVTTGEQVVRDGVQRGAVLARIAASHLRVGTFQYAALRGDTDLLRRLADHAIARHHPHAADSEQPYVALFDAVTEVQASLVARWMLVGFVHGVMNTDNTTISGETIDYGPCAFMEAYDPATVFSSIDHGGRYAYGNQPLIMHWNLARLGETLLPLFGTELQAAVDAANSVLQTFSTRYHGHWLDGMRAKLGLQGVDPSDGRLVEDLLDLLRAQQVDFVSSMRSLSAAVLGDASPARALFSEPAGFDAWVERWRRRRAADDRSETSVARAMDRVNPIYVPRNHVVESALADATRGDLASFAELLQVVTRPFEARAEHEIYSRPAPAGGGSYRTFCGT